MVEKQMKALIARSVRSRWKLGISWLFRLMPVVVCASLMGCSADQSGKPGSEGPAAAAEEQQLPLASLHIRDTPFEIARPAIWVEGPVEGDSVLESWIHPQVELYPNLLVTLEPAPASGDSGAERLLEGLVNSLPGFKMEDAAWQTINGVRGLRSTSTWPSIYGDLTALRMMIPWEGKVVVVAFVDFTPSFRDNAFAYNRCLDALAPFKPLDLGDKK